jgi:polyketide cyclase/dehydrase/lipid transport protein
MIVFYILYVLIAIIAVLLIAALFLPGKYHIEKTIIINKPVPSVMDKVADLNHYAAWNPWQKMEPGSKSSITGTPRQPGHKYSWEGKKIGVGSLTLRDLDAKHVHFDLEFLKPFKSSANDDWLFEEWGTADTKVTWRNNGALSYPLARLMGPMLNKTLNKQFVEGLNNLKALCEK